MITCPTLAPCCERLTISDPGGYEICPVCYREDDPAQPRWPTMTAGANGLSLIEGQRNYQRIGACEDVSLRSVRPAQNDEPLNDGWQPITDSMLVRFEPLSTVGAKRTRWPRDHARLYWWRTTSWDPMT